ncbi:hypothetical protein TI39_contig4271g00003 [Zymoseptoria brevis]|uniref:Uncharacterized protein n=1 Tax=Zymoseptoria brevis TaxID=1047168 RepID=A0A0F4G8N3_9PEZI|nr:hypothetical protein TI39_contig4271g00003 [Zymoseptoria brevis]
MAQSRLPAVGDQHEAEHEVGNQPPAIQSSDAVHAPFRRLDLPDELWAKIGRIFIEDLPTIELHAHDFYTDDDAASLALAVL